MGSFEAHIETLKEQLGKAEARAEKQTADFAERAAQVAAEHTARIKALEGHIETLKAREGHTERVENQGELAALIHALKEQLGKGEARAERQTAEFAERAAQVAAEHTAQLKTLEERIETLKAELSAADTQLAERATEHEANIAAERVKTEAEALKTEAQQAKAARAMPGDEVPAAEWKKMWERPNRPLKSGAEQAKAAAILGDEVPVAEWEKMWERANRPLKTEAEQAKSARAIPGDEVLAAEWEKMLERANRPWWRRMWRSARAEIPKGGSADRYEWQLPSMTFDTGSRPGDKGTSRPLGPHR
jgi:chromosome segregation ATPase